jgi:O-methyltransferase domain/Dimerisation domain
MKPNLVEPTLARPDASPPIELMKLIRAGRVAQSVSVAARLGVADQLAEAPRRAEEVAEAVGAHPGALYRLLRLLAGVGVFAERGDGAFALTSLGELLRSDAEGSMRDLAMVLESSFWRAAWTNLIETVRTGEAAFDHTHGQHLFDYLRDNPEDAAVFDRAMAGVARQVVAAVLDVYDFGRFRRVIDVGGGNGALLAAILARQPAARGVLYELPEVAARATGLLAASGVADRCDVVEGDFFESVPAGGDAYVLARVIHDWDDRAALRILANCRAAMAEDARVLLVEAVLPDGSEPADGNESLLAKLWDMEMLVIGGQERTEAEYRELLSQAGLQLLRVVPSTSAYHIVEAAAASTTVIR